MDNWQQVLAKQPLSTDHVCTLCGREYQTRMRKRSMYCPECRKQRKNASSELSNIKRAKKRAAEKKPDVAPPEYCERMHLLNPGEMCGTREFCNGCTAAGVLFKGIQERGEFFTPQPRRIKSRIKATEDNMDIIHTEDREAAEQFAADLGELIAATHDIEPTAPDTAPVTPPDPVDNETANTDSKADSSPVDARNDTGQYIRLCQAENGAENGADAIFHPMHYTCAGIECIEAIQAALTADEFRGYCKGNVLKYVWRERLKGGTADLRKAAVYLNWAIDPGSVKKK